MGTHTPGPWRVGTRSGERAIYGPKGEEITVFTGMLFNDEELANARLIASAPELLEALKVAREWMGSNVAGKRLDKAQAEIDAVIAKAEGTA